MTKIRKIVITFMLAFYLAVNNCDKSFYINYNTTYHEISVPDYPDTMYWDMTTNHLFDLKPGRFVKQPADFYPGINMISINEFRFSLN